MGGNRGESDAPAGGILQYFHRGAGATVLLDGDGINTCAHVIDVELSVEVVDLMGDQPGDATFEDGSPAPTSQPTLR